MTTTLSTAGSTAGTSGGRRHLGVALFIIATAQLMIVLDATIVYVALPHIQAALGFSGSGLEWVANAYALTFGGLLLLGGRAGDLLGRRRMFVLGLLVFSAASLAGGLATSPGWLLAARAVQGAGGAIVAPTALALIATTFPEGRPRSRAMGAYAAMSVAGSSVGLLAGGLLVAYASWRWVLFVNVPIGVAVAVAALYVLAAPRAAGAAASGGRGRPGTRFDLPGTITGTGGIAALVYGLSNAATSPDGTSHWGDMKVVVSLAAGVSLLAAFAVIESRSRQALLPVRLLRSRDRVGAYLVMLGVGAAIAGVFFFLTLFVQDVWGYSALRTGIAFLPVTAAMFVGAIGASSLVPRVGTRPLLIAGSAVTAGGLYWLSRMSFSGGYAGDLLGAGLVLGIGFGLMIVPLQLLSLAGVAEGDSGAAASLLNAGRQVGGAVGLAVLGTVAWTVAADRARSPRGGAAAGGVVSSAYRQALAAGFDRAFLVGALIAVLMLVVSVAVAISRTDRRGGAEAVSPAAVTSD